MRLAIDVPAPTDHSHVNAAVERAHAAAARWAALPVAEKIALARACRAGVARNGQRMVDAACAAKGIQPRGSGAGEEWFTGPLAVLRLLSKLEGSLRAIARHGTTALPGVRRTSDGRLAVRALPRADPFSLFAFRAEVHLQEGIGEAQLESSRARFYKHPHAGLVAAVLGAGNINAVPINDVLSKLFVEGKVCVLKLNPVNGYLGPIIEDAFRELIGRGYLAVVHGGAEVGAHLVGHPLVDELHLTGSKATHDAIVWGPPGPEADARRARNAPLFEKPVTSELGCVTPLFVAPERYTRAELEHQAEHVAGMFTLNCGLNCATPRLLVTARGWPQRAEFLAAVARWMVLVPPAGRWYPGVPETFERALRGRTILHQTPAEGDRLPWTIVALDPVVDDPFFSSEHFCPVLGHVELGSDDPVGFLEDAVRFANERVFGTLSATLIVHRRTLDDREGRRAVEAAVRRLEYGMVGVNAFAAYAFVFGTGAWGPYPGSPLSDVRSGRGFVKNALMLEHIEKTVVRHPFTTPWKPAIFTSHRLREDLGRNLAGFVGGNRLQILRTLRPIARG